MTRVDVAAGDMALLRIQLVQSERETLKIIIIKLATPEQTECMYIYIFEHKQFYGSPLLIVFFLPL